MGMRIAVIYLALFLSVAVACASSDEEEGSAEQIIAASKGEPVRPTLFAERGYRSRYRQDGV